MSNTGYEIEFLGGRATPGGLLRVELLPGTGGAHDALLVVNRAKRVLRVDLFAAPFGDRAAWPLEPYARLSDGESYLDTGDALLDAATRLIQRYAVGLRHLVSAQEGILSYAVTLGDGSGTKAVPLEISLPRYRLEIVGPSNVEPPEPLPARYTQRDIEFGPEPVIRWQRLFWWNVFSQFFWPAISWGSGRVSDMRDRRDANNRGLWDASIRGKDRSMHKLITAFDLAFNMATANSNQSAGAAPTYAVLSTFVDLLKDAIDDDLGALVFSELVEEFGEDAPHLLRGLSLFMKAFDLASIPAEMGYALWSLYIQDPVYNVLITSPEYRTHIDLPDQIACQQGQHNALGQFALRWRRAGADGENVLLSGDDLWRATARIESGSLLLTDLAVRSAGAASYVPALCTIRFSVVSGDVGTQLAAAIVAWDPVIGNGPFSIVDVRLGHTPVLLGIRPGQATLSVTVVNNDPLFLVPRGAPDRVTIRELPILVLPQSAFLTVHPRQITVGSMRHVRATVSPASDPPFDTSVPFSAMISFAPPGALPVMRIEEIVVSASTFWSEGVEAPVLLPYSVVISLSNGHAEFELPEATGVDAWGRPRYAGLGDFVRGLSAGDLTMRVDTVLSAGGWYGSIGGGSAIIAVRDAFLTLDMEALDGSDVVILEADYDEEDNAIYGGVRLVVATDVDEQLYDSSEPAYYVLRPALGVILLSEIHVTAPDGERRRLPFSLEFNIADMNVAKDCFPTQWHGRLDRILKARRSGSTVLGVKLVQWPAGGNEAGRVEYGLPPLREIEVVVPEDLEPKVISWSDQSGTRALDPVPEVIYADGVVGCRIEGIRPTTTWREATLAVASPTGTPQPPITLFRISGDAEPEPGSEGVSPGVLQTGPDTWDVRLDDAIVDALKAAGPGTIRLQLEVTSGLRRALSGRFAQGVMHMATVQAVVPRHVGFVSPPEGGNRLRRAVGPITAGCERAHTVEILSSPVAATVPDRGTGVYYDYVGFDFESVQLAAAFGEHRISVRAKSDFGATEGGAILFTALKPELTAVDEFVALLDVNADASAPRSPVDRRVVGHSARAIRVTCVAVKALALWVRTDGAASFAAYEISNDGAEVEATARVPRDWAGYPELRDGTNVFTLSAANEFGESEGSDVVVVRRPNKWTVEAVTVGVEPTVVGRRVRIVWLAGRPPELLNEAITVSTYLETFVPVVTESHIPEEIDSWSFSWALVSQDERTSQIVSTVDANNNPIDFEVLLTHLEPYFLSMSARFVDPEAQEFLRCWAPEPAGVIPDPSNQPVHPELWPVDGSAQYFTRYLVNFQYSYDDDGDPDWERFPVALVPRADGT